MSKSKTSENNVSISLFPFLAVLLCTMGALLVLLVILVQRAAERAFLPDGSFAAESPPLPAARVMDPAEQARLQKELNEIASYQKQIDELRAEGQRQLEDERLRLSHAEEHTRRLEEELVKLSIAAQQLRQTEADQTVDQQQAEEELARLEQLVVDTEKQLEAMRENTAAGKKSYAIVPYKGPNGTYRRPIYIECTAKGVTIHPEGLQLTETDFIAPSWPGNPLAAILRASREYLNGKAAKEGAPEPPDPYPLILVRPDGIESYALSRAAITSWDSDYGYEFIDKDMKLAFPEAPDPQLARVQHHALLIARDRLVHLVQAAPSRFRGLRVGDGPGDSGGGSSEYGGSGIATSSTGSVGIYADDGSRSTGSDGIHAADGRGSDGGGPQYGNLAGEAGNPGGSEGAEGFANGAEAGSVAGSPASAGDPASDANLIDRLKPGLQQGEASLVGPRYAQQGADGSSGQGVPTNAPSEPLNGQDQQAGRAGGQQVAGSAGGSPSGGTQGGTAGGSPGMSFGGNQTSASIADTKGANWAVDRPNLKSVAIRRPIPVVVRENKMILSANKNIRRGVEATGREISLDQSISEISHEFEAAVKERIEDWGLAGSGMYWRPVLELNVEPNAQMTATRIVQLLKDSGVEVQLPATANANTAQGGTLR